MQTRRIIYILFFASGACGLIYEIAWMKMFSVVLSNSNYAVSIVLSAFMAGLALGSLLFGRFADRRTDILRIYAFLECGIGLFAVLMPLLINSLNPLYTWVYRELGASFFSLNVVRFVLSFILLLVPTTFMGGTLPVLSRYVATEKSTLGLRLGMLYGFNTFGAVLGTFLTGFFLIQILGVKETTFMAAVMNVLIGVGAFLIGKYLPVGALYESKEKESAEMLSEKDWQGKQEDSSTVLRLVLWVFGLSGFASLAYEVLWTRALSFFIGSTTYAASTMLMAFLCGLAIGSSVSAKVCNRIKNPVMIFGVVEVLIGLSAALTTPILSKLFYITEQYWKTYHPGGMQIRFAYSFVVMLVPTLFIGSLFPIVSRIYARSLGKIGHDIGNVYSANTVGAIFGSFIAGFLLISLVGIQNSIIIVAGINVLIGTTFLLLSSGPKSSFTLRIILVVIATVIIAVVVEKSGNHAYSVLRKSQVTGRSIFYREGTIGVIEVIEHTDKTKSLFINGVSNAETSRRGIRVHKLLSQLPVLLHESPRDILLVALGTGMTAGALVPFTEGYSVRTIDCVEISPEVVKSSRYFTQFNHNILKNPDFRLILEDGRNYLLATDRQYDVIVTGVIHPKYNAGNTSIYTEEYYELCKRKLRAGGVVCQWVPLNDLKLEQFKVIVKTFLKVFPRGTLWFEQVFGEGDNYDTMLIGTQGDFKVNYKHLKAAMEGKRIQTELASIGLQNAIELLDCYVMGSDKLARFLGKQTDINTDDHPVLEFGAMPDLHLMLSSLLVQWKEPAWQLLTNIADSREEVEVVKLALERRFKASQICARADLYRATGNYKAALAEYKQALEVAPGHEDIYYAADFLNREKQAAIAILKTNPKDIKTNITLGEIYYQEREYDKAARLFETALSIVPNNIKVLNNLGCVYFSKGAYDKAITQYEASLRINPNAADVHDNLADLYNMQGRYDRAIIEYETAIKLNPRMLEAIGNLGLVYLKTLEVDKAARMFERVLQIDPTNKMARNYLNQLRISR